MTFKDRHSALNAKRETAIIKMTFGGKRGGRLDRSAGVGGGGRDAPGGRREEGAGGEDPGSAGGRDSGLEANTDFETTQTVEPQEILLEGSREV